MEIIKNIIGVIIAIIMLLLILIIIPLSMYGSHGMIGIYTYIGTIIFTLLCIWVFGDTD